MSIVSVYRVFRTRSVCVYERELSSMAVSSIVNSNTPYIQWMLIVPTVFTKDVIRKLADELSGLPFYKSLEDLTLILEAYPASFHNGVVPELGVLISLDHSFKLLPYQNQRNWKYDHCFIVHKSGRTHVYLKDLPKESRHDVREANRHRVL